MNITNYTWRFHEIASHSFNYGQTNTSLLNRQNYKSIELFENVNPDLIDLLKKVKRSDGVRVLVIQK